MSAQVRTKLTDMMKSPDRGSRLAGNVLTRAFRDILAQSGLNKEQLMFLVELYLRSPANQITMKDIDSEEERAKIMSTQKGNIIKDIERNENTYKVFIKLMEIIRIDNLGITISGNLRGGERIVLHYEDAHSGGVLTDDIPVDIKDVTTFMNIVEGGRIDAPAITGKLLDVINEG